MKKNDLIAELNKIEGNPEVWIRTWEQHNEISDIKLVKDKGDEMYDQGDAPSRLEEDVFPYIVITDSN